MKLGINAMFWSPGRTGGSETYLIELLTRWHDSLEDEVALFAGPKACKELGRFHRWKLLQVPFDEGSPFDRLRVETLRLPGMVAAWGPDVLFSPGNLLPLRVSTPQVVTIHDLQDRLFPEYFDWKRRMVRRLFFTWGTRKAAKVIAISNATKNDLMHFVGTPDEKIEVVYHGIPDVQESSGEALQAVREKYNLPERFAYLPAKTFPHKNHLTLIDAVKVLRERGVDIPVILTGGKDLAHEAVLSRIKENHLDDLVTHLGFIDFGDIGPLYRLAEMLVFPSSFEGFGLPVLEAMAYGCPVVTSNKSSLAEVAGGAALIVEPGDAAAIADAMGRIWDDAALRECLVEKGLQQAAAFSWDKCAAQTRQVLGLAAKSA